MTPGRPPPTIVRRTAWEFAWFVSCELQEIRRTSDVLRKRGQAQNLAPHSEYALRDYS
jgi:hypothetical protein